MRTGPLVHSLLTHDNYMLLADYRASVDCQQRVSDAYRDQVHWTRMSILNTARIERFSAARSEEGYCRDIWSLSPMSPTRAARKDRPMATMRAIVLD